MMSMMKQLIAYTEEGNILISDIQDIVDTGMKDREEQVRELFHDCWLTLEALIEGEIKANECVPVFSEIIMLLKGHAALRTGSEKGNLCSLIDGVDRLILHGFLNKLDMEN